MTNGNSLKTLNMFEGHLNAFIWDNMKELTCKHHEKVFTLVIFPLLTFFQTLNIDKKSLSEVSIKFQVGGLFESRVTCLYLLSLVQEVFLEL